MISEVERLCRYLKNDSLVRWALECDQAEIDAARARIARARTTTHYLPPHHIGDLEAEMRTRDRRAAKANERYLAAVRRANG